MSAEELQQAITLIKNGDRAAGQKLLVEIVTREPGNEMAWLWLASVVPADKRRYCLERVLTINPNNAQARQVLAQTAPAPAPAQQALVPPAPRPAPVAAPPPNVTATVTPGANPVQSIRQEAQPPVSFPTQYWTEPFGKFVQVVILDKDQVISIYIQPQMAPAVLAHIEARGTLTKEWHDQMIAPKMIGAKYVYAPIDGARSIRLLSGKLRFDYVHKSGKEFSVQVSCIRDAIADEIMGLLEKRLGNQYKRFTRRTKRKNLIGEAIWLLVPIGATAFCYWTAQAMAAAPAEGASARVSIRVAILATIVQALGPNGVLCIGGGITLLFLLFIIYMFVNPPMETYLLREGVAPPKS
jgi:hypothetical protein